MLVNKFATKTPQPELQSAAPAVFPDQPKLQGAAPAVFPKQPAKKD